MIPNPPRWLGYAIAAVRGRRTAAGGVVLHAPIFGIDRGPISGVAPGAWIIEYKVCGANGCYESDSMAAVEQAIADGANPLRIGTQKCCGFLKTRALLDDLAEGGYDAAFGGARRDEEKSRAKERVYSFRDEFGQWDPKNQRPELWNLYNSRVVKGQHIRVFPLSNWTELDVWQYIHLEDIPIVPLYFAAVRPVVERDGALIMVDDERMRLRPGEEPMMKRVRFRTLGCYPLTGAIESGATTLPEIIEEMLLARNSERQGRVIDHDEAGSMEQKKREGYF